jgi:hypothetical protein
VEEKLMEVRKVLAALVLFFVSCASLVANDPFEPTADDLKQQMEWKSAEVELVTWIFTFNSIHAYPPNTSKDYDPLSSHDSTYQYEELKIIRYLQQEGIDVLEDRGFSLSLPKEAINAISVMRLYSYDLVITSSREKLSAVKKLFEQFGCEVTEVKDRGCCSGAESP